MQDAVFSVPNSPFYAENETKQVRSRQFCRELPGPNTPSQRERTERSGPVEAQPNGPESGCSEPVSASKTQILRGGWSERGGEAERGSFYSKNEPERPPFRLDRSRRRGARGRRERDRRRRLSSSSTKQRSFSVVLGSFWRISAGGDRARREKHDEGILTLPTSAISAVFLFFQAPNGRDRGSRGAQVRSRNVTRRSSKQLVLSENRSESARFCSRKVRCLFSLHSSPW